MVSASTPALTSSSTARPAVGFVVSMKNLRLDGATYRLMGAFTADTRVRGEPFDAVEIDLAALWAR